MTVRLTNDLINQLAPFESFPVVAVAVSGGADSLALALLAKEWADKRKGNVIALTVDHGLRPESMDEAKQVAIWMKERNIEHHILMADTHLPHKNLMHHARTLRYQLLTDWCREHHILHLLVGHHQGDQVETFLLRLERGSGVYGLAAMTPVSHRDGVRILRPLLNTPKTILTKYLQQQNQAFIHDPTNDNLTYTRNNIRAILSQQQDGTTLLQQRLANTTQAMAYSRAALEHQVAQALNRYAILHLEGYVTLNLPNLLNQPEDIALRMLATMITCISGKEQRPRMENLQRLYTSLNQPDFSGTTLWGCELFLQDSHLFIIREAAAVEDDRVLEPDIPCWWDNRFSMITSEAGYRIGSLPARDWSALLKDLPALSLPRKLLPTLPVIKKNNEEGLEIVISVPHIEYHRPGENSPPLTHHFHPAKPLAAMVFGCYAKNLN